MKIKDIIMLFRRNRVEAPTAHMLAIQAGMAERNAKRIAKIKEEMGEKWILHPNHRKSRLDEPRPV